MENEVASLEEQTAEKCVALGIQYFKEDNFNLAIEMFTQAIQLNPNDDGAYFYRGLCYEEQKDYEAALKNYAEAIRLNPDYAGYYSYRGRFYGNKKNYIFAIKDYSEAIRLNPNDEETYFHRGNCFYKEKNYALALRDYSESINLNPSYAEAYYHRAICYKNQKNYEFSLKDYAEAIRLKPENYYFYDSRADCYKEQKNYEFALKDCEKVLELYDEHENNGYHRSNGEYQEYFEKCQELCYLICSVYFNEKKYDNAIYYIQKASEFSSSREKGHIEIIYNLIKELKDNNKKLELKNQQKESLQNRMQKLVEQFTHSLGNVIFPDTIYQVAERWKNNPECRKDVLLLHEAYHSEITIKLQGELLRQRYANTNPEKFRQFIRNCRRLPNNANNTKSIEDILDYAASRVTARFLNQHYAGLNTIRDKILAKKGVDINALKQKFEDDILLNKSSRPIAWINENLRPVQITEISPLWKKVCILAESHAEALLFGYFSEILFNAFKYADHDKDEFLTLVFNESVINDKTYLSCSWKNPVKDKTPLLGTGKGLDAIQEDLKQLNDTKNPKQSLLVQQQNNQFQVTLFFKKELLVETTQINTDELWS